MTIKNKKILVESIIWTFMFVLHFSMVSYFQTNKVSLIFSSFSTFWLIMIFTINKRYLFKKLYFNSQKKYWLVSIAVIAILAATILYLDQRFIEPLGEFNKKELPIIFHYIRIVMSLSFAYFIGTSFSLIQHNAELQSNEKLLIKEKLETEVKLLKAQINPHFIFNALNNIYSLAYMKNKNAPDSILKLSEMLRYVFYDCSNDRVSINAELQYIENFIAFQQMKTDYNQNITISSEDIPSNIKIAPMLYIPFIENSFKYSRIEDNRDAFVNIDLTYNESKLICSITNSIPQTASSPGSGMGISNVQNRLNIIYKNMHDLKISKTENTFTVTLSLIL